jgi:hypothetical protein
MLKDQARSVEQVLIDLKEVAGELSAKDPRSERVARMIRTLEDTVAYRAKLRIAGHSS